MAKTPDIETILTALDGEDPSTVSDSDLEAAAAELRDLIAEATDGEDPDVDLADELVPALQRVVSEQEARAQAAVERAERAAQIRREAGIDPDEADESQDQADEGQEQTADDQEQVPVAASTSVVERLRQLAATRTQEHQEQPTRPRIEVRPVGPAAGVERSLRTIRDAAHVFTQYAPHVGRKQRSSLLRFDQSFPEDRVLGDDADTNTRRLDAVTSLRAVTAAGGVCAPIEADYRHPICGDRGRPIRDGLPTFQASRGGIRFAPTATVGDLSSAVSLWAYSTDVTPGDTKKPCPDVDCATEVVVNVDAITACLTVGNFQARFSPEFWASRLDLLMVAHDRLAEQQLLAKIDAASTAVTYTGGVNTVVDTLTALDRAVAGLASRHRLIGATFRAILPAWMEDAMRSALASNQASNRLDGYQGSNAQLSAWFQARNIRPIWTPDDDLFGNQTAGALLDYPGDDVKVRVFPEGTFAFLDGGMLDLGTEITDSGLNATNDRQAFMETFEAVAKRGCESLTITIPVDDGCVCLPAASA